jgi:acyl-CoA synthetase (NDP forming)/RimJ/RimL family protein N-acetyltransferase
VTVSSSVQEPTLTIARRPKQPNGAYDALTATGLSIELRPYVAADGDAVRGLFAAASERSSYQRFFTMSRQAGDDHVGRLSDPSLTTASLVVIARGQLVAVGSLHETDQSMVVREAEIGLIVADGRQGEGLGTLVLEDLLGRAWVAGISSVVAVVMPTNRAMLQVFQDSGFMVDQRLDSGEVWVRCAVDAAGAGPLVAERQSAAEVASLDHVLRPTSIAVVGAGKHRQTVGRQVLDHLVRAGFSGRLYAVNPQGLPVGSATGAATVRDIDPPVDLVIVAVNTASVTTIARDCAAAGVRAMLTLSAGFGEAGADGVADQAELVRICRDAGMRLVGPNCIGVANTDPTVLLDATFLPESLPSGATGVLSQSGAATVALVDALRRHGAGVSGLVTVGNKADIGGNDVLPWLHHDSRTRVIAAYLESIARPQAFARLAAAIATTTPIVLLKAGRTPVAAAAASSHTAAAADDDAAVDALCRKANIMRVAGLRELADVSALAGMQPLPTGPRVAIVGNSGGPAVLAADACAEYGLEVARLTADTQDRLRKLLPASAAVGGPVDVTAAATPTQLRDAMALAAEDPEVDVVVAVLTVLGHVPGPQLASALDQVSSTHPDTTFAACVFGDSSHAHGTVPRFDQPEDAVRAMATVQRYAANRAATFTALGAELSGSMDAHDVRGAVQQQLRINGDGWLTAGRAYWLLTDIGIDAAPYVVAQSAATAAERSTSLTFPVVVKGDGSTLVHKSDIGAVRLGLTDPGQVRAAVHEMQSRLGDAVDGVIVQTQVASGVEIIVGATRDARFGPLVMVGRGGVDSDVDPDRAWAMAPVDHDTARSMVDQLRCRPSLDARRGHPAADVAGLVDVVVRVSQLMASTPEISEIDLNPVLVQPDSVLAVDVRVRVCAAAEPDLLDHVRHLR